MSKQIEDILGKRVIDMSDEELLSLVKDLRLSRITPKSTSQKAKKKKKESANIVDKTINLFKDLSEEERLRIIEELG